MLALNMSPKQPEINKWYLAKGEETFLQAYVDSQIPKLWLECGRMYLNVFEDR